MPKSFSRRDIFIMMIFAAVLVLAVLRFDVVWAMLGKGVRVLSPVIIGLATAFILNLLMVKVEVRLWPHKHGRWARRLRRPVAMLAALFIVVAVLTLLLLLVIPQLVDAIQTVVAAVPAWYEDLTGRFQSIAREDPELVGRVSSEISKQGEAVWSGVKNNAANLGAGLLSTGIGFFNGLFNTVIGLIIAIYILADKKHLGRQVRRVVEVYLPKKIGRGVKTFAEVAEDNFSSYVIGQSIDALILGLLCFVGMTIMGMPYSAMISTVVGFTNIVPIVGPYVGGSIGAFVLLTEDATTALIFIAFILILQQIDGNIIMPRVVGGSVGLPALWVLVSIMVMGGLFGFFGVLIAVPLASTLYELIGMNITNRLKEQEKEMGPDPELALDEKQKENDG